jgi:hypothetical protein
MVTRSAPVADAPWVTLDMRWPQEGRHRPRHDDEAADAVVLVQLEQIDAAECSLTHLRFEHGREE